MTDKDIQIKTPYTKSELAEMGIIPLGTPYAGYQLFGRIDERFILDPKKNGEEKFELKASEHRYTFRR